MRVIPSICNIKNFLILTLFIFCTKLLISAFSLPFFSNSNTNTSYPSQYLFHDMEPESLPWSLLTLDHDVLRNICQILDEMPAVNTTGRSQLRALDAFSRTNKALRDISAPTLFREIIIRGNWKKAKKLLEEMQNCPAIGYYARFVPSPNTSQAFSFIGFTTALVIPYHSE